MERASRYKSPCKNDDTEPGCVRIPPKSVSENRSFAIATLQTRELEGTDVNERATPYLNRQDRPLQFLLPRNSHFGWWDSLKALCSGGKPSGLKNFGYLRHSDVARSQLAGRSLSVSFLLHCSLIVLLIYLPQALPTKAMAFDSAPQKRERIYYRVPLLDASQALPRIAPAGPGARPGTGSKPNQLPALGSTAARSNLTVVSKPAVPDNTRQTIYQRSSPPDLRIRVELKLPNIVLGNPSEAPKPLMKVDPNTAKPMQTIRQIAPEAAPTIAAEAPKSPLTTYLDPSSSQPRLAIPLAGTARPAMKTGNGGATGAASGGVAAPGDGADLLVVGVDPAPAGSVIELGPGNRWGEFSISPWAP